VKSSELKIKFSLLASHFFVLSRLSLCAISALSPVPNHETDGAMCKNTHYASSRRMSLDSDVNKQPAGTAMPFFFFSLKQNKVSRGGWVGPYQLRADLVITVSERDLHNTKSALLAGRMLSFTMERGMGPHRPPRALRQSSHPAAVLL